jgi:hypothetical protein
MPSMSQSKHQQEALGPYSNQSAHLALRDISKDCMVEVNIEWDGNLWTLFDYYNAKRNCSSISVSIFPDPILHVKGMIKEVSAVELRDQGAVMDSGSGHQFERVTEGTKPGAFTVLIITGTEELNCLILRREEHDVYHRVGTMKTRNWSVGSLVKYGVKYVDYYSGFAKRRLEIH